MGIMFILILVANLVISFMNARSCGQVWAESKAVGGMIRLLVWCGVIQAAIGFTYVYAVLVGYIALSTGYISPALFGVLMNLTYVAIIGPALGTGLIIAIQSWISFAREKSLMNLGVASWNTFAEAYNAYNAIQSFGPALDSVASAFGGGLDSDDDDNSYRIILLALIVLLAGIMTTVVIVRRYEASLPVSENVRNANRDLEYR